MCSSSVLESGICQYKQSKEVSVPEPKLETFAAYKVLMRNWFICLSMSSYMYFKVSILAFYLYILYLISQLILTPTYDLVNSHLLVPLTPWWKRNSTPCGKDTLYRTPCLCSICINVSAIYSGLDLPCNIP